MMQNNKSIFPRNWYTEMKNAPVAMSHVELERLARPVVPLPAHIVSFWLGLRWKMLDKKYIGYLNIILYMI